MPSGRSRRSASSSERPCKHEQLMVGEPAEVARPIDDARVYAGDLGSRSKPVDPQVDLVVVLRDRMPFWRGEHHVQLVEASEAGEELAEGLDDRAVVRQQ